MKKEGVKKYKCDIFGCATRVGLPVFPGCHQSLRLPAKECLGQKTKETAVAASPKYVNCRSYISLSDVNSLPKRWIPSSIRDNWASEIYVSPFLYCRISVALMPIKRANALTFIIE